MNIITKVRTKELVREIKGKIPLEQGQTIKNYFLYYNGDKDVRWLTLMDAPRGYRNLWIPMGSAYEEQEDGSYVRKNLGELDGVFYRAINESRIAQVYQTIRKFELKRQASLNQGLRYMNIGIQNNEEEDIDYLYVFYRNELGSPRPDKEGYKGLDGVGMGKRFEDFLIYRGYSLQGIENKSEELGMFLRIDSSNLELWENLIEAAKEFDKYLRV